MNALTAVQPNAEDPAQHYRGFTLKPSVQSPRLLELTFSAETTEQFLQAVAQWPVQALEYKSFLRFKVGKILDDLCGNQLQPLLLKTLLDRAEGAHNELVCFLFVIKNNNYLTLQKVRI